MKVHKVPEKDYYTTRDLCKVLNISPDAFRYRLLAGHYPEPIRVGGKRRFDEKQLREILEITERLIEKGVIVAGKVQQFSVKKDFLIFKGSERI